MNQEIQAISQKMEDVFSGAPWYGKSVLSILGEVERSKIYAKPSQQSHSAIDLLFHMINWLEFTQLQLEDKIHDPERFQRLDWREIDPSKHTWELGITQLKESHNKIMNILWAADDTLLDRQAKYREYNMRYLLNGLIDHNIYHIGQMALLQKSLS